MGFILDGLETESYDRQYSDRDLLDRIVSYFRPYRGRMVMIAAMITGNSLMGCLLYTSCSPSPSAATRANWPRSARECASRSA